MSDIADRAAAREAEILADALAKQAREAGRDRALGAAPTRCVECSVKIPPARMRAVPGCRRCKDCQETLDLVRSRR